MRSTPCRQSIPVRGYNYSTLCIILKLRAGSGWSPNQSRTSIIVPQYVIRFVEGFAIYLQTVQHSGSATLYNSCSFTRLSTSAFREIYAEVSFLDMSDDDDLPHLPDSVEDMKEDEDRDHSEVR